MNYSVLVQAIERIHHDSKAGAAEAVNRHLVLRNWLIGAYIVEYEQSGADRADYGQKLLARLSGDLKVRGVPGTSPDMLERMRHLYRVYPQLSESISAPAVRNFTMRSNDVSPSENSAPAVRKSPASLQADAILRLSWTHLADLVRIDDPWKRAFYENECLKSNWSKRQLQRQIGSLLYERAGLSTDKQTVIEAGRKQASESPQSINDLIRDPYVLEFTGQSEKADYLTAFQRDEGGAVAVYRVRDFAKSGKTAFIWNDRAEKWDSIKHDDICPGMVVMLPARSGGYDAGKGWTGNKTDKPANPGSRPSRS